MSTLKTSRIINANPEDIFSAISSPDRLARWWGPEGFTSTFDTFEFKHEGRWVFTMHGPDGKIIPTKMFLLALNPRTRWSFHTSVSLCLPSPSS